MRFEKMIVSIDTHTCGEPTRTVTGGIGPIPGNTVADKMLYLRDNMDNLRTMLMHEPRGHSVMSGAILVEPCHPDADVGVIYMETGGYLPMCGHDTIGFCTALVEAGIVVASEPATFLTLETPAGLVKARISVEDGIARSVTFTNTPSFLHARDKIIDVPELGKISIDIAYGGNFFAIVNARELGITIDPDSSQEIIRAGKLIKQVVSSELVSHPEKPFIQGVTHVYFEGDPSSPETHGKGAVLITHDAIDRSPCGTGTCARLASMHARGGIGIGEAFVNESIIGTRLSARIVSEACVAGLPAVVCEVTASAFVTGIHHFVVDPGDPLKNGFLLC